MSEPRDFEITYSPEQRVDLAPLLVWRKLPQDPEQLQAEIEELRRLLLDRALEQFLERVQTSGQIDAKACFRVGEPLTKP
jgi:hypothetical protein